MDAKIAAVKKAIEGSSPICHGTCQIPLDQNILTYGMKEDGSARWVNLSTASPEQLDAVSEACQKATFGRNKEDVLDETYRKAGQMSAKDFKIGFNLEKSGVLDAVHAQLLEAFDGSDKRIDAELYKLNVYGKGSFFKAHKDTPRAENMFGSLVVVFPAAHVGGALLLRHGDKEEEFNSAGILSPFDASTVAYVAFYGDVEHEVSVVESGHRVTLTYNLYYAKKSSTKVHLSPSSTGTQLQFSLSALLADATFLPKGGILGFGLRYMYPVDKGTKLDAMKSLLKGADALLVRVCKDIGLDTSLKAVYSDRADGAIMLSRIPNLGGLDQVEGSIIKEMYDRVGGEIIEFSGDEYYSRDLEITEVTWITEMSSLIDLKAAYVHYGNEASLAYIYGDLALMVDIPAAEDRDATRTR
ncbi:hypothetical protein C8F04DRAFT_996978 [Mycena alexandri]|uniref:Prolyl 4-hydroxylase alpha subunit Fe(2+) 2OG dioxygenase domain-containing protein n=1 Tax=Mycena alexandri TaxID=1745969 RepID=A0AAD6X935_9AGAR|nr:hypothetical protein C8F04DRAFT_996978 [Mycena alexandri]